MLQRDNKYSSETYFMARLANELTGPRVYVAVGKKGQKLHLTGGVNKPNMSKAMCGAKFEEQILVDARDIAPREGYQDGNMWCKRCLAALDFEALDQKILFSTVRFKHGTYCDLVLIEHLKRPSKLPASPFDLTPVPPREEWRIAERD